MENQCYVLKCKNETVAGTRYCENHQNSNDFIEKQKSNTYINQIIESIKTPNEVMEEAVNKYFECLQFFQQIDRSDYVMNMIDNDEPDCNSKEWITKRMFKTGYSLEVHQKLVPSCQLIPRT